MCLGDLLSIRSAAFHSRDSKHKKSRIRKSKLHGRGYGKPRYGGTKKTFRQLRKGFKNKENFIGYQVKIYRLRIR